MFFNLTQHSTKTALVTAEHIVTYRELQQIVDTFTFHSSRKELVLLLCNNTIEHIAAYISALQKNHAIMLLNESLHADLIQQIITTYEPKWIVTTQDSISFDTYSKQGRIFTRLTAPEASIHPELALLLSTSGTTGSQKFVRLTYNNLQANAESIAQYLELHEDERALMNLPLAYSYGLSIINSHFQVGASVILTEDSVVEKKFWQLVEEQRVTSLPGVPFTYQLLNRVGFFNMNLPYLKTLTQAGGRLDSKLVQLYAQYAKEHNKRFFVMYGQTEAAPRISYVPSERILDKVGSIGIAIPNGSIDVDQHTGELIYKGKNVMMGYATTLSDLAKGDECYGVLYTGDVVTIDEEGYVTIVGRMKRFIKLFGLRINLDEIERRLEAVVQKPIACTGTDDKLRIMVEDEGLVPNIKSLIQEWYKLHHTAFRVVAEEIPRFNNGKINYQALKDE